MKCQICGTDNNVSECKHYEKVKESIFENLNETQFNVLSYYATFLVSFDESDQFSVGKKQGIESACVFAGIDENIIFEVKHNGKNKGLRNFNKLTTIVFF